MPTLPVITEVRPATHKRKCPCKDHTPFRTQSLYDQHMRAVHPTGQSAEGMTDSGPDAPELEEPPPSRPPDDQPDSRAAADPHEQKPEDWFPFDNFSTAAIAAFATDHLSRKGLKGLLEILRNPAFKVSDLAAQTMQGLMGHVERRLPFAKTTLVDLTTVQQIVRNEPKQPWSTVGAA